MSVDKDRAWEEVQKKAFTHWVNTILDRRAMKISNLVENFGDGITIIHFVELLCERRLKKKFSSSPKQKIHKIENTHLSLEFLKDNGVEPKYLTISSEDFVDGNLKLILGFLWMLFRKFRIAKSMGVDDVDKTTESLLNWVREVTNGYKGVSVRDFRTSFNDGNALLALVHAFDKEAFNYDSILEENSTQEVIEKAFELAEQKMGIPQLLDVRDLMDGTVDERSVILYVSLYFHAFISEEEKRKIENEKRAASAKASDLENEMELLKKKVSEKEEEYSELKNKYEEKEKDLNKLVSEKEQLEGDVDELRRQFKKLNEQFEERRKLENSAVDVLRKNLLEHLEDMNTWKAYLEPSYESTETIQLRSEKDVAEKDFEGQLQYLSEALSSENQKIDIMLKKRELEEKSDYVLKSKKSSKHAPAPLKTDDEESKTETPRQKSRKAEESESSSSSTSVSSSSSSSSSSSEKKQAKKKEKKEKKKPKKEKKDEKKKK